MSDQSPPSEHDQLAHLVDVEIPRLEAERDAAVKALERVRENARSWHGPPTDTGHERALAVIATWCDEALASLSAADTNGAS